MKSAFFDNKNTALVCLLEKYRIGGTGKIIGNCLERGGRTIPLCPWRLERRLSELKNLIDNKTLEGISTLRFAHMAPAGDTTLDQLIFQELDLCEWIGGSPISRLFAVFNGDRAVNIVVRLESGISASVECGVMLPAGTADIRRHEIIARRGVASDQAVDTQCMQHSIYVYTAEKTECFTDVDAEIFGLPQSEIHTVRAAFHAISRPEIAEEWTAQARRLQNLIQKARRNEASVLKGAGLL